MIAAIAPALLLAGCDAPPERQAAKPTIEVRSAEQDRLHTLNELNLAIAMKRAIQSSGYTCRRVESAGFVTKYKNLDMWTATCTGNRRWAIYAGPDGTAQVRDCGDVARFGLPECTAVEKPATAAAPDA